MADASYTQTSFLGGEISQWSQGAFDKPYYKIALTKAFNIWPTDEGAAPRRPGFRFLGTTEKGQAGRLIAFDFSQATPYNLELTDNLIRMWNNTNLVTTNDNQVVQSISSATPAVFTLNQAVNWSTGDTVYFAFSSAQAAFAGNVLLSRQFTITMLTDTSFNATDAITGEVMGAAANIAGLLPVVNHALTIPTTYSAATHDWHSVRFVQGYNVAALLHTSVRPQALQVLVPPTDTTFATFGYGAAPFRDGPYLDSPPNAIATPSTVSAVTQITVGYNTWANTTIYGFGVPVTYNGLDYISVTNNNLNQIPNTSPTSWQPLQLGSMVNSGAGFVQTDVGRMIRLFSQPQIWSPATTYGAGDVVTYNGSYFTALTGSNTNNQPDISITAWVINPSGAIWTWGFIIAVNAANNVTVQIQGAPLLYQKPILVWRLGAWSDTTGWPTCGVYHEGRFWYGGAIPNRTDSSQPNEPFNMAPTGQDGTVADNNGISYTFNATEQNPVFWGIADHDGIIWGTQEGEFLMTSGTSGNPITASNIQARRETKYGSSDILPVRTGLTICFVKRYARRIMEYLADVLSGRFFGNDLTQNARHLGARGIEEIDYQEELVPTLWARCTDGSFIGSTYRRKSLFSNQEAEFNAWHQHRLGSDRNVESISVGPSVNGTLDALSFITNDPSSNIRYVEQMTTLLDETAPITQSWFLDTAVTPKAAAANINSLFSPDTTTSGLVYESGMYMTSPPLYRAGVRPIVASGSETNVNQVWALGLPALSGTVSFEIQRLDVTGTKPVLLNTYNSTNFAIGSTVGGVSWALDPTGRYIVCILYDSNDDIHLVIFDTQTASFGTVLSPTIANQAVVAEGCQIVWLDSSHVAYQNYADNGIPFGPGWQADLGIDVCSVSGTTLTHVGWTNAYPSAYSYAPLASNRSPLGYGNIVPSADSSGFVWVVAGFPTIHSYTLYGKSVKWQSGSLHIGTTYTIGTFVTIPTIGAGEFTSYRTSVAGGETTFLYTTSSDYYLASMILKDNGSTITRPWQEFTYSPALGGAPIGISPTGVYFAESNTIVLMELPGVTFNWALSTIYLDAGSFVPVLMEAVCPAIPLPGSMPPTSGGDISLMRLDAQRFIVMGEHAFGNVVFWIVADPPVIPSVVTFYTLEAFNGKTVSVFAAGIDCGDYVVENGQVSVPVGTVDPVTGWIFNEQTFKTLQPLAATFDEVSVPILYAGKTYNIPCVIGFNYESQGQLCRPQMDKDTGAKNGPGFGKKRQTSKYAIQVVNSVGVRVGVKLDKTNPVPLTKIDAGGKTLNYLDTFTGIIRETLDDNYSYDSMLAWKTSRPYPTTITAIGGFLQTQDV